MSQTPLRRGRARVLVLAAAALPLATAAVAMAPIAGATPTLAVTGTSITRVAPNSTTTLSGLSVSGDTADTLQVTVATDVGTLTVGTTTNLTLAYNNHWSGDASVTFSGLQSDIDTALATVSLASGSNAGSSANVSITAMIAASGVNYLAPNQHFYSYVASPNITWQAADTAAKASSFDGQPGYLATIPSDVVNNFITSKIQGASNVWFGARAYESAATDGTQAYATVNGTTYARVWRWTEGANESPIAGGVVSECTQSSLSCDFANSSTYYQHWSSGEPNNANATAGTAYSGEWAAVTNWSSGPGLWNDLAPNASGIGGYVIEYGGNTNTNSGGTGFTGVVTTSNSVLVAAVPAAPAVTATRGDSSASLSWSPPANNGSAVTSYQVSTDGGTTWTTATTTGTSPVTTTITGLTNGTTYQVEVRAINGVGTGAASSAAAVTPAAFASAPTVTATAGDGSASLSWTPPANNGSTITSYQVSTDGGTTWTTATTTGTSPVTTTITGLTNGTTYQVEVRAINGVGNGAASSAVAVTPAGLPAAPSVTVTRADSSASLSWTPPANNGSTITSYQVSTDGGTTWTTATTNGTSPVTTTITGLTNGTTYSVKVRAINGVGNGAASSAAAVTPAAVPSAPAVTVVPGNASATVSWSPPANNGSTISSYQISTDGGTTWTTATTNGTSPITTTVNGLTNGTSYAVEVRAVNGVGNGAASAVAPVTPATLPGTPTGLSVVTADSSASLTFTTPSDDGGSPITGYEVSTDGGATWAAVTTAGTAPVLATVSGLANGSVYSFAVRAVNTAGVGPASTVVQATPARSPSAPTNVAAAPTGTTVVVSWSPPADSGGAPIVGYDVVAYPGGATCSTTGATSCAFTSLAKGQAYSFTVTAVNSVGTSNSSSSASGTGAGTTSGATQPVVIHTAPGAPTGVKATSSDGALAVTFMPPADNGGSMITGYLVSLDGGRTWQHVSTTGSTPLTAHVTGVADGLSYRLVVRAVTAYGKGDSNAVSGTSVPAWFTDPVSRAARRVETGVPANPVAFGGRLTHTSATARSWNGSLAMDVSSLHGRRLQPGQAATLGTDGLFAFDSAQLDAAGKQAVKSLVASLKYDKKVSCEGYSDYGGEIVHQVLLSIERADAVCAALRADGATMVLHAVGFGQLHPVVVGGTAAMRAANRRVVVVVNA